MIDRLMRTAEVAPMLGIKVGTLANQRCRGQGPVPVKRGFPVLYRESDVQAYIAQLGSEN